MARRKRRSHTSALTRLWFTSPTASNPLAPSSTMYIDIAQVLSACNRRFYRQGYCYNVVGFEIISDSNTGTGPVTIYRVPETWAASGAWEKSFAMWNKMNDQALDLDPSIKPKFHDFKIYMDTDHVDIQSAPGESDGNSFPYQQGLLSQGEWDYSKIQIPNNTGPGGTSEYVLHMTGANASTSKAMIQGYAESRSVPFSPDPVVQNPSTGWMNRLFDEGDNLTEITNVLEVDNDELPYNQLEYPGGDALAPYPDILSQGVVTSTTIGAITSLSGGLAPCGLLRIDNELTGDSDDSGFNVVLYLSRGQYKGYDAIPMQDVN